MVEVAVPGLAVVVVVVVASPTSSQDGFQKKSIARAQVLWCRSSGVSDSVRLCIGRRCLPHGCWKLCLLEALLVGGCVLPVLKYTTVCSVYNSQFWREVKPALTTSAGHKLFTSILVL